MGGQGLVPVTGEQENITSWSVYLKIEETKGIKWKSIIKFQCHFSAAIMLHSSERALSKHWDEKENNSISHSKSVCIFPLCDAGCPAAPLMHDSCRYIDNCRWFHCAIEHCAAVSHFSWNWNPNMNNRTMCTDVSGVSAPVSTRPPIDYKSAKQIERFRHALAKITPTAIDLSFVVLGA